MRSFLLSCLALALAGASLSWADPTKDSRLVAAVRKKLSTPVTVDFSSTPLNEALQSLEEQVEGLKFRIVETSRNQPITYEGKNQPLKDVLAGMFKKNGLGYFISKKTDRYEGWIIVKQGKERGDELTAEEPKVAKETEKPTKEKTAGKEKVAPKKKAEPEEKPADDGDRAEKDANVRLKFAKILLSDGKTAKAKERLESLIKDYPNTSAAEKARDILKDLK